MADRIAIMDKGHIMQVATPAEVYEAPASRFVADFVGNVNILEGRLSGVADNAAILTGPSGAQVQVRNLGHASEGREVAYAIRPEKIRVSSRRPEGAVNVLEGEVWDIGYLGDMTVYNVRLPDGAIIKASALNSARMADDPLSWEDHAYISFAPDAGVVLTE